MSKAVRSAVLKRSIVVAGHKTSVSLEDEFWENQILCRNLKMEVARVLIAEEGRRALVENSGLRATVWPGA
jgi:predicted DNA-binding ribbon-helix-helix protein